MNDNDTITYTAILKFKSFDTLKEITKESLLHLINNDSFEIDYFGGELDNQADYIDAEMENDIKNHSFLTFYFDMALTKEPNFEADNNQVIKIISEAINEYNLQDVRNFGKDVDVYLY